MNKEIKIVPPEGYEIDVLNSNLECIKFKPIQKNRWRDNKDIKLSGYYVTSYSSIREINIDEESHNVKTNFNVFATEKQAKSSLAMARISQIMANDERFGGIITDEEWLNNSIEKFCIVRCKNEIRCYVQYCVYHFLAFHTENQRDLFLEENEDLVKDYLMID